MAKAWHANVRGIPKATLDFHTGPGQKVSVLVRLEQTASPAIRAEVGADTAEIVFIGRCSNPSLLPSTIRPGMTAPLTVQGVKGTVRLDAYHDSRIEAARKATGETLRLVWSAGGI